MKTHLFLLFSCLFLICAFSCAKKTPNERSKELIVYAYDSFVSEWGPANQIAADFETKTGYKVTFISCGDAAQVLSRSALEKKQPIADILLGIDNQLVQKAILLDVLEPYTAKNLETIPQKLRFETPVLTPYDWGAFAFIWNSKSKTPPPQSLEDLLKSEYAKKIILLDPRTSTPGIGFAAWTIAVFGVHYTDFWRALKPNILTVAPGWDSGYGLFLAGEAPLVLSYTTSAAYHVQNENSTQYQALIFPEGHITQIEGAGVVKNAPNAKAAKLFLDFLIDEKAQQILPLTQWMYPVNQTVELPQSFKAAPIPQKILNADYSQIEKSIETITAILLQK